ncbi:MAG: hypothetical protein KAS23_00530 [Anaerohalosphaera sp.]|nr:hypothetical protein [Anaerohalosphaera sp.]
MKSIDIKSMIIGVLLTLTIILSIGAVPNGTGNVKNMDKWDDQQQWEVIYKSGFKKDDLKKIVGYEPFATTEHLILYRKRIK